MVDGDEGVGRKREGEKVEGSWYLALRGGKYS